MLTTTRASTSYGLGLDGLGETLLNLAFLRLGLRRNASIEQLPDHLRRDVGLLPREKRFDPRDWRW